MMMTILNFYFLLFFSMLLSLSVSSNFMMWISLELNMLSFLPIITSKLDLDLENAMKYFLVQSWASIIFLLSFFFLKFLSSSYVLMMMSMLMKLGLAPFHVWFISILKTSSLYILMILSSVQKVIPLMVLIHLKLNFFLLMTCMIINLTMMIFMLPSSINLNKIMALSSMNNVTWMLASTFISTKLLFIFLIIYVVLLSGFFLIYKSYGINMFNQMNSMNFFDKMILLLVFMSLGGMPPLLGFLSKYLVVKFLLLYESTLLVLFMIFTSLFLLYFYMSRMYFFLTYMPSLKFNLKVSKKFFKHLFYVGSLFSMNLFFILY